MSKDPVCGMMVDEKRAAATAIYQGTTYYFCAQMCKRTFEQAPEKYIGKKIETRLLAFLSPFISRELWVEGGRAPAIGVDNLRFVD